VSSLREENAVLRSELDDYRSSIMKQQETTVRPAD
jgi:hypothetical protein